MVRTIAGGFFMGAADLVPGVSGGTIALVLGIYERLVESIREGSSALGAAIKTDFRSSAEHLRRVEWGFLVPLLSGIALAVVLLASVIEHQLEERPVLIAGVFLGLVAASVVIAWRKIHHPGRSHWVITALVGVTLFAILGLGEGEAGTSPTALALLGSGALAICAMILPGISGSLILLMIGMYGHVLGAVTGFEFGLIAVFVLGAIVGLAAFSQVLHWALQRHHDNMMAALVGLMAGSTRILWPWPDGVSSPDLGAPGEGLGSVLWAAAVGVLAVWLISRLASTRTEPAVSRS